MSKEKKFLYETVIWRQFEEKATETKTEGETSVQTTKVVKVNKPIKAAILKPNRRLYENADIFYAKTLADYIKIGLLPYSLVAKRYSNDGGPLSESQKETIEKLKKEAASLQEEFFSLGPKTDETSSTRKTAILVRLNNISSELTLVENSFADVFENTADVKARSKTIEWWSLFLSYIDEDGTGYKPLYGEGNLEEKLARYDELDELESPFYNETIKRLAYLISFYFASKGKVELIDFKNMESIYLDTITDYDIFGEYVEPKSEKQPDVPVPEVENKIQVPSEQPTSTTV